MRIQTCLAMAAMSLGSAVALAQTPELPATQGPTGDVIVVTGTAPAPSPVPHKGMDKSQVVQQFGQPAHKRAAVGGSSRQQPPISRWDYDGYSVFFEYDHVVHAVRQGRPMPIKVRDGLQEGAAR